MHEFPQKWGKYILLDHLASGGMAEIFIGVQASDLISQRLVIIKRIRGGKENKEEMLKLLQIEAQALLSLQSPYIVHTYDFEKSEKEEPFLVMEYIEGLNLKRSKEALSISGMKNFPVDVSLEIAKQVAFALTAAHDCKNPYSGEKSSILHRDISPQNIILSSSGYTKLIDFGVAKAESFGSATLFDGQIKGKVNYMSPEQFTSHEKIDGRTDIFSLGVVLWELLTGEKFFSSSEMNEELAIEKFTHGRYKQKSFKELNLNIDSELENFIGKMLEIKKDLRPASALEVSKWISNYQTSKKLSQGPELLKEFLNDNLGEQLRHERHRIHLLIEKSKNTPLKENSSLNRIHASEKLKKKTSLNLKYVGAAFLLATFCLMGLVYVLRQKESPKIARDTPLEDNRRPSSQKPGESGRTLGIPADDQNNLRTTMKWAFEMKQRESSNVIKSWNKAYDFEAKTDDPRTHIDEFKKMDSELRHNIITNVNNFTKEFDQLNSDSDKIKLIEKYSNDIKKLPPPRRNNNNDR